jgi:hypothetical protein
MTALRDGVRVFAVLRAGEQPRADERPVRFGGAEDAARFLERIGAAPQGAHALRDLLDDGFGAARLRDAEVPRVLAPRFASGELRAVEIHGRVRLSLGPDEYLLLDRAEPPRRDEILRGFHSPEEAERFLGRMWDDQRGRRPLAAEMRRVLRHPADQPATAMRDLAVRLASGSIRMVRIAPVIAPAPSGAHTGGAARVPAAAPAPEPPAAASPPSAAPPPMLPGAVTCGEAWAAVNGETQRILARGGDADPIERNRHITAAYAELYQRNPRLEWSGLAAIVSRQGGCAMEHARDTMGPVNYDFYYRRQGRPYIGEQPPVYGPRAAGAMTAYNGLADTNEAIFGSIYPVMRFYDRHGMEGMRRCGSAQPAEPLTRTRDGRALPKGQGTEPALFEALSLIDSDDPLRIQEGSARIARYEQGRIVQNLIYDDWETRTVFSANQWAAEHPTFGEAARALGARRPEIPLSAECGAVPVVRFEGDITVARDRIAYYHSLMRQFRSRPATWREATMNTLVRRGR